ncbi:hypothetical protein Sbal117_3481 [Shewanella baltica OS117]|nr:hypothetical protein Sbal117_3481 [Shewanella baltica OS117]
MTDIRKLLNNQSDEFNSAVIKVNDETCCDMDKNRSRICVINNLISAC